MERKTLRQYRELRAKIVRLDKKIAENTYPTQDVVRSGGPKQTAIIRGLYNGPKLRDLRKERVECFEACREIEEFIQGIEDPVLQDVFALRYLDGDSVATWQDISQQIGGGNSEDSIRKKHNRFLGIE